MAFAPKILKENARLTLDRAPGNPRRITLIHEGVFIVVGILLAVLNLLLTDAMNNAGGLSGMGTRTFLSTALTALNLLQAVLAPFWSFGIIFAALGFARAQDVTTDALFAGFRRFGSCLRLMLVETLFTIAACFMAVYTASFLYSLMPMGNHLMALIEPVYEEFMADPYATIAQLPIEDLTRSMLPLLTITGLILTAILIPLQYFLRLSQYILLDKPDTGAFAAVFKSFRYMKGNIVSFIKLDLSFWWYYTLNILITLIAYLDQLLPALGVNLPISPEAANLIFYGLYALGLLCLAWFANPYVFTAYAQAYEIASNK